MAEKGKRQANFELLRIVAMCFIITLHFLGHGGILDADDQSAWFVGATQYIEALSFCAVNIYVLISGYFMSKSRFSWKRLFLTEAQVWIYSIGIYISCCLASMLLWHSEPFSIKDMLTRYLLPVTTGQYWFVTSYIILCLISPFLNLLFYSVKQQTHKLFIVVLVCLFSIVSTLFKGIASYEFLKYDGYTVGWFVVLYAISSYFRLYGIPKLKKRSVTVVYLLSAASLPVMKYGLVFLGNHLRGRSIAWWNLYTYNSIPVLICSICVFLFFARIRINSTKCSRIILWLASHSFAVYLIHDHNSVRDLLWETIHPTRFVNSPLVFLALPITVISIYLACCLIDQVRAWLFIPLQRSKRLNALFAKLDAKTNAMLSPAESPDGSDG